MYKCGKKEETGDFPSTHPYKTKTILCWKWKVMMMAMYINNSTKTKINRYFGAPD
jgi:hypothetical protein